MSGFDSLWLGYAGGSLSFMRSKEFVRRSHDQRSDSSEKDLLAPSHRASFAGVLASSVRVSELRVGRLHLTCLLGPVSVVPKSSSSYRHVIGGLPASRHMPPNPHLRRHLFATSTFSRYQPIKANLGTMASLSMTSSMPALSG